LTDVTILGIIKRWFNPHFEMSSYQAYFSSKKWISLAVIILLFFSSNLNGRSLKSDSLFKANPLGNPNEELRVHRASTLWFSITNYGQYGSFGENFTDPETGQPAPSAMFPAGSGLEYLFLGSIWIGAIADGETLVSVGHDGWERVHELNPDTVPLGGIVKNPLLADNEYIAVFTDTFTDPRFTGTDNYDGPHRPLGIEITQHSYSWVSPPFNDFVILDYKIKNIKNKKNKKNKFLSNVYIGIYIDGDVLHPNLDPGGFRDDVTGFLERYVFSKTDTIYDIAWIADNDGVAENKYNVFDSASPLGVLGVKFLGSSFSVQKKSYHWWISYAFVPTWDWGPWKQSNFDQYGYFLNNNLGTPTGDAAKYFLLQNGEIDYDEIYTTINHTDEGWMLPSLDPALILDYANGFDTRFLFSFGGFDLAPGDSATFAIAVVAGDSMHRDPSHFNFKFPHQAIYFFDDLAFNAKKAQDAYNSGYTLPVPGPPANFKVENLPDNKALLAWSKKESIDIRGYNLYKSTISGNYSEPLNENLITDTLYVDTNLTEAGTYYYTVACVDSSGNAGLKSKEISVLAGRPHPASGLKAKTGNGMINLVWNRHSEEDVYKFKIYRTEDTVNFILVDSVSFDTAYTDYTVQNGTIYYYRITVIDFLNLESFPSDTVFALPMAFDRGVLIVDETNDIAIGNFSDTTLVNTFYQNLYSAYSSEYWNNLPFSLTLTALSPYSILVIHSEDVGPTIYLETMAILKNYARAGGKILIVGNKGIIPVGGYTNKSEFFNFSPNSFGYQYLHLASGYQPFVYVKQFVGAKSQKQGYPDVEVDTAKANKLYPNFYGDNFGRLPLAGYFVPLDSTVEILYTFVAADSDTATFAILNEQPCGMLIKTETYQAVFLDFPLFFLTQASASALVQTILKEFEKPTGVDPKEPQVSRPKTYLLNQNYPNPFNQSTTISYSLSKASHVNLTIYNLLGRKVRTLVDESQPVGYKTIAWDGQDNKGHSVSSGIYFYRLKTIGFEEAKKMLFLK